MNINIDVTGPGGCINSTMDVIQRTFEYLGYKIVIENDHDDKFTDKMTTDELETFIKKHSKGCQVTIKAHHCPWGG
jgi:hypothetical protein